MKNYLNFLLGGRHKICFVTTTSHWFTQNQHLRFEINVKMNVERSYDMYTPATHDQFEALYNISRKMNKRMKSYISIQKLNRENEDTLFEVRLI